MKMHVASARKTVHSTYIRKHVYGTIMSPRGGCRRRFTSTGHSRHRAPRAVQELAIYGLHRKQDSQRLEKARICPRSWGTRLHTRHGVRTTLTGRYVVTAGYARLRVHVEAHKKVAVYGFASRPPARQRSVLVFPEGIRHLVRAQGASCRVSAKAIRKIEHFGKRTPSAARSGQGNRTRPLPGKTGWVATARKTRTSGSYHLPKGSGVISMFR